MFHFLHLILLLFVIRARSENTYSYEPGDINKIIQEIITNYNITNSTCISDILDTIDAMTQNKLWAIKMLDASSKLQSGLAMGNMFDLGSYDECLSVKGKTKNREIKGKYCLYKLYFTKYPVHNYTSKEVTGIMKRIFKVDSGFPLIQSICVPESCSSKEISNIFDSLFITQISSVKLVFDETLCQVQGTTDQFTVLHWCTLFLFVTVLLLIIIGTLYDFYLRRTQKNPNYNLMISFSLCKNITQLTTIRKDPDQLPCINGIRSISMLWIIMGHEFSSRIIFPHVNYLYIFKWLKEDTTALITGGLLAVDTFLLISGLLVIYVILLARAKNFKFGITYYYLHRILRLSPVMIVLILFYKTFLSYFFSGPMTPVFYNFFAEPCKYNWWRSVLYLQNTIEMRDVCMSHTWYLAVDTQLYFLAPLLFLPMQKWPKKTLFIIIILIIISCISGFIFSWNLQEDAGLVITIDYKRLYASPLVRSNAWLIGTLLGYLLFIKRGKNVIIHKVIVVLLWIISMASMLWIIYLPAYFRQTPYDRVTHSLYYSLSKAIWCVSLSWVIFACVHGYAGPVNKFLSNRFFIIFGRLTYSIYLCHVPIIIMIMTRDQQSTVFSTTNTVHDYFGDLPYIIVLGLILSLCFESPIIAIGKKLMPQTMADQLQKIYKDNEIVNQEEVNERNFITKL